MIWPNIQTSRHLHKRFPPFLVNCLMEFTGFNYFLHASNLRMHALQRKPWNLRFLRSNFQHYGYLLVGLRDDNKRSCRHWQTTGTPSYWNHWDLNQSPMLSCKVLSRVLENENDPNMCHIIITIIKNVLLKIGLLRVELNYSITISNY